MVLLICGASHTGKTALAQRLLEKHKFPYLSIDHLKMGLIRSKNTALTPTSGYRELTAYLWGIVREIVKTAVENKQNLIIEGCYIPFDWKKDFDDRYLRHIKYLCLIMSGEYIESHFDDIKKYRSIAEERLADSDLTAEILKRDNMIMLRGCRRYGLNYLFIDGAYNVDWDIKDMS